MSSRQDFTDCSSICNLKSVFVEWEMNYIMKYDLIRKVNVLNPYSKSTSDCTLRRHTFSNCVAVTSQLFRRASFTTTCLLIWKGKTRNTTFVSILNFRFSYEHVNWNWLWSLNCPGIYSQNTSLPRCKLRTFAIISSEFPSISKSVASFAIRD